MPSFSDDAADALLTQSINVERVAAGSRKKVLALLVELEDELEKLIRRYDLAGVKRITYRYRKTEALLKQTQSTIATFYSGTISPEIGRELRELADYVGTDAAARLNAAIQGSVFTVAITRGELTQLVGNTFIVGSPAKKWWQKQARDLQQAFAQQVRLGMLAGESNDQIVRRVRGRNTGRKRVVEIRGKKRTVPVYEGGILDTSRRNAAALVQTATNAVSNATLHKLYEDNADVLRGVGVLVTLDDRTSDYCISISGGAWNLATGDPLSESRARIRYPGPPPYHYNCRTVEYPITKSFADLLREDVKKARGLVDTATPSTRASIDGQVAGTLNYESWLKTKPEAFQRRVLGPARYDLWKRGKLSLTQLVDQTGRSLTVRELRARAGE